MNKIFESKISYLMLMVLFVLIVGISFLRADFENWTIINYSIASGMFLIWIYFVYSFHNTRYIIYDTDLVLVVKPFYKKTIPIASIKRVEKSSSLMSSPAPSFNRLEIFYGKFESELVSPKDQKAFAETLQKLNPNITIKFSGKI